MHFYLKVYGSITGYGILFLVYSYHRDRTTNVIYVDYKDSLTENIMLFKLL